MSSHPRSGNEPLSLLVERCQLAECEAMCCYDGVYMRAGDEARIREALDREPGFFGFLPDEPIVVGRWRDRPAGRKTATRPFAYANPDYPAHFEQTRCVFALADGRCSLQVFAAERGEHPWTYKPSACWQHPLRPVPSGPAAFGETPTEPGERGAPPARPARIRHRVGVARTVDAASTLGGARNRRRSVSTHSDGGDEDVRPEAAGRSGRSRRGGDGSGLEPPPIDPADDPVRCDGYPGYVTFTSCGRHRPDGRPWREVFREELAYFEDVCARAEAPDPEPAPESD